MKRVPADRMITIAGAGPSGLAAAIVLSRRHLACKVYERSSGVGHRFHGDFQGLENWTSPQDVLVELAAWGIEPDFPMHAVREAVVFGPDGREFVCRSEEPLFYLVQRGGAEGSLEGALMRQAQRLGAEVLFNEDCGSLPEGGIVAQGPHRADVIATGWTFETAMGDGTYVALSEQLAPGGYAYVLIHAGRGTIATCMFDDFHNERAYLERTVEFFERQTGLSMVNARRFGGTGNFAIPDTARKNAVLHVGECAGFQDAFAGFGMRCALRSGWLAAEAVLSGRPEDYDRLWKKHLRPLMRASVVNRFLYAMFGDRGYRRFLRGIPTRDVRPWLRRRYGFSISKACLYPLARRRFNSRLKGICVMPGCSCTWCRCEHRKSATEQPLRAVRTDATKGSFAR